MARTAPFDAVSACQLRAEWIIRSVDGGQPVHTVLGDERNSQASWGVAAPRIATNEATLMMLPPMWRPLDGSALFCSSAGRAEESIVHIRYA